MRDDWDDPNLGGDPDLKGNCPNPDCEEEIFFWTDRRKEKCTKCGEIVDKYEIETESVNT